MEQKPNARAYIINNNTWLLKLALPQTHTCLFCSLIHLPPLTRASSFPLALIPSLLWPTPPPRAYGSMRSPPKFSLNGALNSARCWFKVGLAPAPCAFTFCCAREPFALFFGVFDKDRMRARNCARVFGSRTIDGGSLHTVNDPSGKRRRCTVDNGRGWVLLKCSWLKFYLGTNDLFTLC